MDFVRLTVTPIVHLGCYTLADGSLVQGIFALAGAYQPHMRQDTVTSSARAR